MQNKTELDGKAVVSVSWPDSANETGQSLRAQRWQTLTYREYYLGDHSECWIVVEEDGKELSRHNTRFIESIVWAK